MCSLLHKNEILNPKLHLLMKSKSKPFYKRMSLYLYPPSQEGNADSDIVVDAE